MNINGRALDSFHGLIKYAHRFSSTPIETLGFVRCEVFWEDIRKFEKDFRLTEDDIESILPPLEEYNILSENGYFPIELPKHKVSDGRSFIIDYKKLKFLCQYNKALNVGGMDILFGEKYDYLLKLERLFEVSGKTFEDIYKINIPGENKIREKGVFIPYIVYFGSTSLEKLEGELLDEDKKSDDKKLAQPNQTNIYFSNGIDGKVDTLHIGEQKYQIVALQKQKASLILLYCILYEPKKGSVNDYIYSYEKNKVSKFRGAKRNIKQLNTYLSGLRRLGKKLGFEVSKTFDVSLI